MKRGSAILCLTLAAGSLSGCNNMPGRPLPGKETPRPAQILSFDRLYGENCAGCHGTNGEYGPATDLANPEYQSWIDDARLHTIVANGEQGTMMPAFSKAAGGELTDEQVDAIVSGVRSRWRKGNPLQGLNAPPYTTTAPGNAQQGQQVYSEACARCHGSSIGQPGKSGSILDGSLLALMSEQGLRTTVVTGRPDLGMPDWRNQIKERALTDQEVTDVVAWIMSQRPQTPGQPYPQPGISQ